ncbi:MAG TPA: hypothetical protein VFK41_12730 [Nocardioidaceae bacterium]|nr:hypothetical protein [Nocardioidaceae bacterium]
MQRRRLTLPRLVAPIAGLGLLAAPTAAAGSLLGDSSPTVPLTWAADLPEYDVPPAPPLMPIEVERTWYFDEIPVPDGVQVTSVEYAPDFDHWLLGVTVDGASHLAVMRPDGSDWSCVTCGHVEAALKMDVLHDERRVWFADNIGSGSDSGVLPGGGTGDFQWSVLECSPSVYDCAEATVLPVDFPLDSLTTLPEGAQNREATPDGEGRYVVWNEVRTTEGPRVTLARLERTATSYVVREPRVVQPAYTRGSDPGGWVDGGRFYEGGKFVAGNRYIKYQATRTGLNYDTGLLDLQTGEYRFLTRDLDYNEVGNSSPDGRWYDYSSARGLDRMDVFTQLVRPPFLDMAAFGQVGRVGLWNNRRCMNEAWLMDIHGQRTDGYAGQPIVTEDNWLARERQWLPDGRQLLLTEQLLPNLATNVPRDRQFRVRLVTLPELPATTPLADADLDDVDWESFTVPAADYTGMASRPALARIVQGRHSGTVTLNYSGTFASGTWSATYRNYSDDGLSYVSGVESISVPLAVGAAVWSADLRSTGARKGFTRGTVYIGPQSTYSGDVTTEINGQRWSGIPAQADCPGVLQPQLRLSLVALNAAGTRLRAVVTAQVAEDPLARPVRGATVRVGNITVRTDASGAVTFTVPAGSATSAQAEAGGFRPASAALPGSHQ